MLREDNIIAQHIDMIAEAVDSSHFPEKQCRKRPKIIKIRQKTTKNYHGLDTENNPQKIALRVSKTRLFLFI